MPKRMVEPTIKELSGVDHPAHLSEGWLMMKDASPETARLLADAELIAKGFDPRNHDRTGSVTMPISDAERAALPDSVQDYIKSLESSAAPSNDTDADLFEKSLAALPKEVRKSIRDTQKRAADAEAMVKSLHDDRERSRFEAMAKELSHLPGVDADGEFAATMRKAAESNSGAFDEIFKVLKAADAAIDMSGTYGEIGSAVIGAGTAAHSIEAVAKGYQSEDPSLSYPEAMVKAAESHPELYAQHRKEV